MSCCNCKCRKGSSGWLAFWLLATLLFIGYAQAQSNKRQVSVDVQLPTVDQRTVIEVQPEPEPMSKPWYPTNAEMQNIDRLLREMEQERDTQKS